MAKAKVRIANGTPPFVLNVRNADTNALLYATTNSNDEIEIPDEISDNFPDVEYQVTDADLKSTTHEIDEVSLELISKYHAGMSISNGDFENHLTGIDISADEGLTYCGVIYERNDVDFDDDLQDLDSITFDHTQDPSGGIYLKGFDEVVRHAKVRGISLRVGIHLSRENVALNNGTTRTLFYGNSAMNLRPNGELTYKPVDGPVPSQMIPSYASTEFRTFAKLLVTKFMRRYRNALNDGTIMSIGVLTGTTGEAEYVTDLRETDGSKNEISRGDFHPQMIAKFKAHFPQHASLTNDDIAFNDLQNNDIAKRWYWTLADTLREFEWELIDYASANVAGLTRTKWFQIDVGSFLDGLAPRRRTFNLSPRVHPKCIMVKSNDNSHYSTQRHRLIADHMTSAARKYGGIAICEPSPQSGRFDEGGGDRPGIQNQMDANKQVGSGVSIFTQNIPDIQWMVSAGGLNIDTPPYKNEFKTISGRKTLMRFTYLLSDILSTMSSEGMLTAYNNYLSTNGIQHADIVVIDDIDPNTNVEEPQMPETIGTYSTISGDRTYTYNKTPGFDLQFNLDGTISDVTPGLNTSGSVNTQGGKNVFYMIDYSYHEEEGGVAGKMQNMYLIDHIYTLRKFTMNPTKYPDMASFKANRTSGGYNTEGVNQLNGDLAEIMISITSTVKQGKGLAPKELVLSRELGLLQWSPDQDWTPYNKFLGITWINNDVPPQAPYQAKGLQPNLILGAPYPQNNTWLTFKVGQNTVLTTSQAYQIGRDYMNALGATPRSMYTSEFIENEQGAGSDSYNRVGMNVYRGAMDVLREHGHTNVLTTGLFGEYGSDDFYGFFDKGLFYGPRNIYEQSLTDMIYRGHGINGFGSGDHDYFTKDHILHRNLNSKYYLFNQKYNFSLEFLMLNEKVKLSTKTWNGIDRERSVIVFSTPIIESFVINDQGNKINIEQSRAGEIIPFPNGEILTRMNTQPPIPWGAAFAMGFWSTLLCAGAISWDAPNRRAGNDTTKLNWDINSDQQIRWKPNGGTFGSYNPGQNGAPLIDNNNGLINSLWTSPTDALVAGKDAVWAIRNRIQNLRHVAYTSSRGGFTPTPGQAGLHLNGHGPINWGLFVARDIYDAKKGTSLRGDGVVIYVNEFLAPNLYEDNVTIAGHNLGRVYGGQIAIGLL